MRLPTEQNKTPKINVNANQVIKTEATDIENVGGNSVDQGAGDITVSGSMESSDGAVNSAIVNTGRSNSTLSQPESGESTNLSSIVKGEPPELPGIAGNGDITASGSYSEIAAPGGLSLGTDFSSITGISADSVQASTSVSPIEQHSSGSSLPGTVATVTEQNVLVKTEVEDDDEELEITGVEPGQMSVSDNAWMSNVQTSMGYDPSMSGAVNMGESTGPAQGYDPSMPGAVNMSGSSGQGYGECLLFVFHLLTSHILPLTLKQNHKYVASFLRNDKADFRSIWFAVYVPIHYFTLYLYLFFFFASFEKNETFMY